MKNILKLAIVGLALLVVACANPDIEIVEHNDSYELDPNEIHVDMPQKLDYNVSNIIKNEGRTEVVLYALENGKESVAEIPLVFRLKRSLQKATTFVFSPESELIKLYTGIKEGFNPFPDNAFSGMEFTIPAGVTAYTTTIRLQDGIDFSKKPGFLSAYRLKPTSGDDNVKPSVSSEILFIKLKFSLLRNGNNISLVDADIENNYNKLPSNKIILKSNYQSAHLSTLVDGQKNSWSSNWWIPGNGEETLELGFDKQKVGAIVFYTCSAHQKLIRSLRVWVSEDKGASYFDQGVVKPEMLQKVCVTFKDPVEIDKIKFSNFESWNTSDPYIDIHEIEVYTVK